MPTSGKIYYFETREGNAKKPPVVLIHGAGGTHLHWPHNIRRLGDWKVYAPDLPGHGKSEGLGAQSVEGYAKTIIDWLTDIGVSRAVFIGHSMGGAIAQHLALEHAEFVTGLGLIGSGARYTVNADLMEKISMPATFEKGIDFIVKWSYDLEADKKLIETVRDKMLEIRPSVLHGDFEACRKFNSEDRLGEIKAPTCVICGENDKMMPPRNSEALAEKISKAKLDIIPGAGHMVMLEQPEAAANILAAFLESIPI
jgi:pimeloyl-ACP methyl ester carboxylesterase